MPEADKRAQQRKDKIRLWLKDGYNLTLVAILILAFIFRAYLFFYTSGQTLWYDEAEYGSMAKHYVFNVPYELSPKRPFMFSGIMSVLMLMNLSEQSIKFLLDLIPSTLLVLFIFLLGREMFNKKVGLISAFLAAFSWTLVFWTARMQPDFLSMCFQVLAILFMWKFFKNNKPKTAFISGMFASLGFAFKVSGMLVPIVFLFFIFFKDRLAAFKNKGYWIFLAAFILFYIPQGVYSYFAFGNPFAIFGTDYVTTVANSPFPLGWYNFNFYYYLTEGVLFYLFLLGVFISLKFVLYFDSILKDKNKVMNPGLFSILLFALVSAYYIFWIRNTDDRWVFLWLPFIFFMIGEASVWIFSYIKKYNKIFAFILIACLLGYGAYSQATHADSLTKIKKDTYSQVRDAALWIKDNSSPGDVLVFPSTTQSTYYSERETISFYDEANLRSYTPAEFDKVIEKVKPKFIVISVFEPSVPQWTYTYPQVHNESFIPVNVWFADAEKKNPIIIIYEINYSIFRPTN